MNRPTIGTQVTCAETGATFTVEQQGCSFNAELKGGPR